MKDNALLSVSFPHKHEKYLHPLCFSGDHHNGSDRLLLNHIPKVIDRRCQWSLRGNVFSCHALDRRPNTVGIDVICGRIAFQNQSCFVIRQNILESISGAIFELFPVSLVVHHRFVFRLLIQQFEFQAEASSLSMLCGDQLGQMLATLMDVPGMEPVRCTGLNEPKGRTVGCHEDVVLEIEMHQFIQRFEAINLFSTAFPVEKPLAIGIFDFDVGDFVRCFDTDDVVTWHRLGIANEKEADLIARIQDRFRLRMRDGPVVISVQVETAAHVSHEECSLTFPRWASELRSERSIR